MKDVAKNIIAVTMLLALGFGIGFFLGARGRGGAETKARSALEDLQRAIARNGVIEERLKEARGTVTDLNRELRKVREGLERLENHNKDLAEQNSRLEAENHRQREIVAALTAGTGENRKRVERIENLAEEGRETITGLLELLED